IWVGGEQTRRLAKIEASAEETHIGGDEEAGGGRVQGASENGDRKWKWEKE
ncbi:hypothetical protein BHE90_014448, partial [Fusarium euwallaceae]